MAIFNMKPILWMSFMLCLSCRWLSGQVQFANIHQVPLILSPSNVGSKYGHRFVLASNSNSSGAHTNTNHTLSFDTFSRRKRLAIGLFYWGTAHARNLPSVDYSYYKSRFEHKLFESTLPIKEVAKEGGLCIGIKYNILDKDNPNIFKASITPVAGISLGNRDLDNYFGFSSHASSNDSLSYKHHISRTVFCTSQLGFKYNSEHLLLMYHIKFRKEWVSENHIDWYASSTTIIDPYEVRKKEAEDQFVSNSFENRVSAAYNIAYKPKKEKLSLTLYGSLGLLSPMAIARRQRSYFTENSYWLSIQKQRKYQYLASFSALAKVYQTLWGVCWARSGIYTTYCMTGGLQSKYFKLLGTYFPHTNGKKPKTLEVVLAIYIPE